MLEQTRREMGEARITEHQMMQWVMRESLKSQEEGKKGGMGMMKIQIQEALHSSFSFL